LYFSTTINLDYRGGGMDATLLDCCSKDVLSV